MYISFHSFQRGEGFITFCTVTISMDSLPSNGVLFMLQTCEPFRLKLSPKILFSTNQLYIPFINYQTFHYLNRDSYYNCPFVFYLIFAPTGISSSTKITLQPPSARSAAQIMPLLSTPQSFAGFRFAISCIFLPVKSSGL